MAPWKTFSTSLHKAPELLTLEAKSGGGIEAVGHVLGHETVHGLPQQGPKRGGVDSQKATEWTAKESLSNRI